MADVRHTQGHKLEVTFNDGAIKVADLRDELYGEVFELLRELGFFRQAKVNEETDTIEWPDGANFAPKFLHERGEEVKRVV